MTLRPGEREAKCNNGVYRSQRDEEKNAINNTEI